MTLKIIAYAAAAVLVAHTASAQFYVLPTPAPVPNAFSNYHVPPPMPQYQPNYGMPAFAQPIAPPPPPVVVVPFNTGGSTSR